jgi:two-component system nitrate/nitrite sensor histidine kinase NarX
VEDALSELKGGLEAAYRQLRELLTTFRLQMDGQGLGPALEKTVEEYESRCDVDISLENRLDGSPFSVNEEIHVLQIVREALSNVVHHSRATQARVRLEYKESEGVLVSIKDNGIGIPQDSERTHHYGLAIMRERANSLHGELTIEAQETGGTQVRLCLKPTGLQQETVKS